MIMPAPDCWCTEGSLWHVSGIVVPWFCLYLAAWPAPRVLAPEALQHAFGPSRQRGARH